MSGIYGVISHNEIEIQEYNSLLKWNENYGDLTSESFSDNHIFLGIKPEHLKDYHSDGIPYIIRSNGKTGVFDSLIFSDVPKGTDDNNFLFSEIINKGIDVLNAINGDFAGAVWDEERKELLMFRDHIGVRPLYYYHDKYKVVFSSDIRGITSLGNVDTSIDENWIFQTVVNIYSPSNTDTEYQNIKCVPPGGYVRFSIVEGMINLQSGRYWIPGSRKIRMKGHKAYTKELRRLVEDAVRIRANATGLRIGAELSGGLDSGVISLLLANMKKDCFYYSWSPSPEVLPYAENDERLVIGDICERAGIKCNYGGLRVSFSDHDQIRKRSPLLFDEESEKKIFMYKYAFPNYVNTTQIYETAAVMQENGVKFVFTGHSGDEGISHRSNPYELFYNHEYYRYFRLMFSRSSVSKNRFTGTLKLIRENQKSAHETILKPIPRDEGGYSILNKDFVKELKPEDKWFLFPYDPKNYIRNGGIRNRFDVVAFYGASVGVRYLAPYADYRVIDFALGIPRYLYHNWYLDRFIFREAFKDLMPRSLYYVKEKANHSYDNLPKNNEDKKEPDRTDEALINARRETLNQLNRDYWEKYFDYNSLEKWVNGTCPPEYDQSILKALLRCMQAEYMVKRSKELKSL